VVRVRVGISLVIAATVVVSANARSPLKQVIAHRSGHGSVAIGVTTNGFHQLFLSRLNGVGSAKATVSVACTQNTAQGTGGGIETFVLILRPNTQHQVWRYLGSPCRVTATVRGAGELNIELRGS
jgi:hypothetical protein